MGLPAVAARVTAALQAESPLTPVELPRRFRRPCGKRGFSTGFNEVIIKVYGWSCLGSPATTGVAAPASGGEINELAFATV